jgi:hypothetical protein
MRVTAWSTIDSVWKLYGLTRRWPSAVELGDCRSELMLVRIWNRSNARSSTMDAHGRSGPAH